MRKTAGNGKARPSLKRLCLLAMVVVLAAGAVTAIFEGHHNGTAGHGIVLGRPIAVVIYTYTDDGAAEVISGSVRVRGRRSITAITATLNAMSQRTRNTFYPGAPGRHALDHDLLKFRYAAGRPEIVDVRTTFPIVIASGRAYGSVAQWEHLLNEIGDVTAGG